MNRPRAADLWWLHPARIVLLALLPLYLSFLFFDFSRVVKNVYIPGWHYLWGGVLLGCLALGMLGATALARARPLAPTEPPRISRAAMLLLLGVALLAYAVWFGPLVAKPQALLDIVLGRRAQVRDAISTTPGITTLTQFGIAYAIAYAVKLGAGVQRVSRLEHAGFVLLVLLAVFRAFAWAERLAVIELLVCFTVARMAYLPIRGTRAMRAATWAPLIAPPVLYLIFTASEFLRSWHYYENQFDSVWAFTLDRLITYYATASNNGIGILEDTTGWPTYNGRYAFKWAWYMPGLGTLLESTFGAANELDNDWLRTFAREEFNSPTAYFRVVLDFGYFGSVLYFLALGWLIGRAYAAFRHGHVFGLLLYPVFVVFLTESLRYNYLAETRIVPLSLGLAVVALEMRRLRRHRPVGAAFTAAAAARGSAATIR